MRQIVSCIVAALIAASASQAVAAQSHRHVHKQAAAAVHIRKARNAIAPPPQTSWQY